MISLHLAVMSSLVPWQVLLPYNSLTDKEIPSICGSYYLYRLSANNLNEVTASCPPYLFIIVNKRTIWCHMSIYLKLQQVEREV